MKYMKMFTLYLTGTRIVVKTSWAVAIYKTAKVFSINNTATVTTVTYYSNI